MDELRHGMDDRPGAHEPGDHELEPFGREPLDTHPPADVEPPAPDEWQVVADRVSAYGRDPDPLPAAPGHSRSLGAGEHPVARDQVEDPHAAGREGSEFRAEDTVELRPDPVPDPVPDRDLTPAPEAENGGTFAPPPFEPERGRRRLALRRRRDAAAKAKPARKAKGSKQRKEKQRKDKKAKKLVGLKIGASQIAAARVVNNGVPELVEVAREPLDAGVVVSGEIRDPDALADALRRFFDLHKLPKKGVRLGLSNNRIGVRVFEIEGVSDPRQLENAVRFRAEEVLPIPLDEAVLDYVVLDDGPDEGDPPLRRILLVVAYREVVDRYLEACRRAGLGIVGIDLEGFALLRSLAAPTDPGPGGGALVAVAVGHDRTTIAVSTGRYCEFTRVLDWGGWSLNVALARDLDRAPSEVESIKRQLSFSDETGLEGLTPEQSISVKDAAQRALATFARELVASLHFYQAQPGALGIGEIVLTGGTAHMTGLPEELARLIGVPVRVGDPFRRVKVGPKVGYEGQTGSLAVAIGLGIED